MPRDGWQLDALCPETDPEIFFGRSPAVAKRICDVCPVKAECLAFALDGEIRYGVWGGATVGERLDLLRQEHGPEYTWPTLGEMEDGYDDLIASYTRDGLTARAISEVVGVTTRTVVRARARTGTSNYQPEATGAWFNTFDVPALRRQSLLDTEVA